MEIEVISGKIGYEDIEWGDNADVPIESGGVYVHKVPSLKSSECSTIKGLTYAVPNLSDQGANTEGSLYQINLRSSVESITVIGLPPGTYTINTEFELNESLIFEPSAKVIINGSAATTINQIKSQLREYYELPTIDHTELDNIGNNSHSDIDTSLSELQDQITQLTDQVSQLTGSEESVFYEIGDYKFSAKDDDHGVWLLCNGQEVDKNDYSGLYEIIGDAFGDPETSTNFIIPDARYRVIGISDNVDLKDDFSITALKVDTANQSGHFQNSTSSPVAIESPIKKGTQFKINSDDTIYIISDIINDGDGNNEIKFTKLNGDAATELSSTTTYTLDWIKAKMLGLDEGKEYHALTIDEMPTHKHGSNIVSGSLCGLQGCDYGGGTTAIGNTYVGGGEEHNIMQPTLWAGNLFIYSGVQ